MRAEVDVNAAARQVMEFSTLSSRSGRNPRAGQICLAWCDCRASTLLMWPAKVSFTALSRSSRSKGIFVHQVPEVLGSRGGPLCNPSAARRPRGGPTSVCGFHQLRGARRRRREPGGLAITAGCGFACAGQRRASCGVPTKPRMLGCPLVLMAPPPHGTKSRHPEGQPLKACLGRADEAPQMLRKASRFSTDLEPKCWLRGSPQTHMHTCIRQSGCARAHRFRAELAGHPSLAGACVGPEPSSTASHTAPTRESQAQRLDKIATRKRKCLRKPAIRATSEGAGYSALPLWQRTQTHEGGRRRNEEPRLPPMRGPPRPHRLSPMIGAVAGMGARAESYSFGCRRNKYQIEAQRALLSCESSDGVVPERIFCVSASGRLCGRKRGRTWTGGHERTSSSQLPPSCPRAATYTLATRCLQLMCSPVAAGQPDAPSRLIATSMHCGSRRRHRRRECCGCRLQREPAQPASRAARNPDLAWMGSGAWRGRSSARSREAPAQSAASGETSSPENASRPRWQPDTRAQRGKRPGRCPTSAREPGGPQRRGPGPTKGGSVSDREPRARRRVACHRGSRPRCPAWVQAAG